MPVALLSLALAMAITGSNVVVGKLLAEALPVPVILFARCSLAVLILAPIGLRPDPRPPRGWVLGNVVLQSVCGTVLYNVFLLAGLRSTGALQAGIVLSSLPAVVAVGAAVVLRERLTTRRWLAAALAACGVALVAVARNGDMRGNTIGGDALVTAAVCCEGSWVLLSRAVANRFPVNRVIFWTQAVSTAILLPLALPRLAEAWPALTSGRVPVLLAYNAISASVLCNLLWYAGMRRVPASLAGIFTIFLPVTAALLALLVLDERFVPALGAGFALALASLVMATWPARATAATHSRSEAMVMRTPE